MKLPHNLDGDELVRRLKRLGYEPTRQTGSHIRLTRISKDGEQHITIPNHTPLRIGTLNSILTDIAMQLNIDKDALLKQII